MDYLLLGPEEGEKAEWLQNEKNKVLNAHPDAEVYQIYTGDDDKRDISLILSQNSLFSSFRLVIIKQYEQRSGNDRITTAVSEYLKTSHEDAELIIISSEKSTAKIPKDIVNGIGKDGTMFFWEMFEDRKRDWIRAAFRNEGLTVTPEAVEEILFSVENNTQDMKVLVNALTLYFKADGSKREITDEDINQYAVKTRGEDGYTLFQAVSECDLEHSLLIAKTIAEVDSSAVTRAFAVLVSRFRLLEACWNMRAEGKGMDVIAKSVTALSPYPASFNAPGLKLRDKAVYAKAMSNYSKEDSSRIVSYLGSADIVLKSASSEIQSLVLTDILYTVIKFKGRKGSISLDAPSLNIRI